MTLLTRWEPFRELSTMQDRINRMNRLFRESYSAEGPEEALTTTSFAPPVDIYEDEHNITLKLEVPGIDEKDIDVRIENTTLTIQGERKIEIPLPSDRDMDRVMSFMEQAWRRLVEMANRMQKDVAGKI